MNLSQGGHVILSSIFHRKVLVGLDYSMTSVDINLHRALKVKQNLHIFSIDETRESDLLCL